MPGFLDHMNKNRTPEEKKKIGQVAKAVVIAAEQTLQQELSAHGVTVHRTECTVAIASTAKSRKP